MRTTIFQLFLHIRTIKGFLPNALSYVNKPINALFVEQENEKKHTYNAGVKLCCELCAVFSILILNLRRERFV